MVNKDEISTTIEESAHPHGSLSSPLLDDDDSLLLLQDADTTTRSPRAAINRRTAMTAVAAASAAIMIPSLSSASSSRSTQQSMSLDEIELGNGIWKQLEDENKLQGMPTKIDSQNSIIVPSYFATYAVRFLINYDPAMASWWRKEQQASSLLPEERRQYKLGKAFGSMSRSMQLAFDNYVHQPQFRTNTKEAYTKLLGMFINTYSNEDEEVKRQIGLLFCMLPSSDRPNGEVMSQFVKEQSTSNNIGENNNLSQDLTALLSPEYHVASVKGSNALMIYPALALYEVGESEEFGETAVKTPFGPLSTTPLIRLRPNFSPLIYGLFGISGATGCALTHSVVIPLDVVKTRAQTDPEEFSNLLKGAAKIVEREGIQGLLLGAQATLAGYFWYGLSVYPSYTFFKRWFYQSVLPPEIATIHVNDIAIVAGALAAVLASLGLTPLEAARIRVVAEPEKYRKLGLTGTLTAIADEDKELGWASLYAGFPSLLTRQVIFGSIKFLAFERTSEAIFAAAPSLRDATWTALVVSLVAGGIAGSVSSIVSQPADSVLTYVSQNNRGSSSMGVIEGCRIMILEGGVGSLFRGSVSRCLWAGSIIAGQFLLYDVFRTIFSVTNDDLSQVYQITFG